MKLSMNVVVERAEMNAVKKLMSKINELTGSNESFNDFNLKVKTKNHLQSVMYAVKMKDTIEFNVELEVNPTVLIRQVKAYSQLMDIASPIVKSLMEAIPAFKKINAEMAELQSELNSDLEVEITKE